MPMTLAEFGQLKKMLTLATSENDHEALASWRKATALLSDNNMTWDDIVDLFRKGSHIVYALIRSTDDFTGKTGEILYIGEGVETRIYSHARNARENSINLKDQIIARSKKLESPVIEIILFSGLTKKKALRIEKQLIIAIGRYPNGSLLNVARGSRGAVDGHSLEFRIKRLKQVTSTEEYRKRKKQSALNAYADPIKRANHLNGIKRGTEKRDKELHSFLTSLGTKKAMHDPEIRKRHLESMATEEYHNKLVEAQRRRRRREHESK